MEIWNNYKKEKLLNSGIYTNIYQAKNIKLGNYVAIKEINKKKYNKLTNHSFKKEEIIKNININDSIKLIEIIDSKENFYIIMNLCLINLDEYIKIREQPLSINEIREILIQINELIIKLKNKNQLIIESSNILINIDTINKISIKLTKSIKLNNELQSETNQIKLEDNNLLNLGILIYYMLFKEYPSNDIILKKKELKIKEIKNNELKDLLNKLFKINSNKTISWEEYFNHSFFKKTIFPKFYFICKFHSKLLNYYCIKCKYNICDNCLYNHKLHEIISFKEIGINDSEKKEFEELIKKMNNNIEKLNMMKREMEEFLDDIKLISGNSLIFENEKKNDYKKYYINCLKIINDRITIEDTINIINLKNYILCNYDIKKEKLHKNIQIINYKKKKKKKTT